MTEPREKLSATQVRDASLADWRQILGRIKPESLTIRSHGPASYQPRFGDATTGSADDRVS